MSAVTFSTRAAMDRKSARILPQYNSLHHRTWWKFASIAFVALALFLTMYTGFLVAIGGTLAFRFVGFPILVMAGVSLWLLPDVDKADNAPFFKLLAIYMFLMVAWPSYVAIAIPGLPWVTPPRLVLGVLLIAMLTHFPQIAEARRKVVDLLGHDPLAFRLYGLFLQNLGRIFAGGCGHIVVPLAHLNPAASQTKVSGRQVQNNGRNGDVFHPDIRFSRIGADHDSQGGFGQKRGTVGF